MKSVDQPVLRDIVLIGGGHSHVGVIKKFGMAPWPGVRLTVICTDIDTPYSGMLPGYIAGHYSFDDVHIDLGRLCAYAGARFIQARVTGLDRAGKKVICEGRPPIAYDAVSINIGSTPRVDLQESTPGSAVPVKPIAQFNLRWQALLARVRSHAPGMSIAVVGGGAGGVELTLAMQFRLRNELIKAEQNPDTLSFHLLTAGATLLPTHNTKVQQEFLQVLTQRGVQVHLNAEVTQLNNGVLTTSQGLQLQADEVMWVTQAKGAAWLANTGLDLDEGGFIAVKDTLQSVTDDAVFAAGDVASFVDRPLEKAGVFAVRMGKPLTENLKRHVQGTPLVHYRPQRTWLALISTGDKYAVASKGAMSFSGAWVWQWKDWIDRRFMRKFTDLQAMDMDAAPTPSAPAVNLSAEENQQAISAIAMRCGGCGAKVGANVLSRALQAIHPVERDDVLVGLHAPDDAAIVRVPPGKAMVHTVDFFRAFIDDPYVFGKVAANHALGDVFAMGGQAQSATAVATVPPGLEAKVEETLFQMMSGAVEVLNEAGCALVGGHTGEGKELALGFAINGLVDDSLKGVMIKGGLKAGQVIILTKPIGTGTLFAALPQLGTRGVWIQQALDSMVQSNRTGAAILMEAGATACTDLTGFGLLGHLVEMIKPSGVDVQLKLTNLPLLEGALETTRAGIVSSLQPANVRLRRAIQNQAAWVNHPLYPLLFDPQTAGGLLASVPLENAERCVERLRQSGYPHTAIIGQVLPQGDALEPVLLTE